MIFVLKNKKKLLSHTACWLIGLDIDSIRRSPIAYFNSCGVVSSGSVCSSVGRLGVSFKLPEVGSLDVNTRASNQYNVGGQSICM